MLTGICCGGAEAQPGSVEVAMVSSAGNVSLDLSEEYAAHYLNVKVIGIPNLLTSSLKHVKW